MDAIRIDAGSDRTDPTTTRPPRTPCGAAAPRRIDSQITRPGFRRVLLKLGGEMFGGGAVGVDPTVVDTVARQIAEVVATGAQIAVVIGGGNFFRGAELHQRGIERTRADYMGMLGTVMNCLVAAGLPGARAPRRHPRPDRHHDGARSRRPTSRAARSGTWRRAVS